MCVFVHGFEPYFYAEKPADWTPDERVELLKLLRVGVGGAACLVPGYAAERQDAGAEQTGLCLWFARRQVHAVHACCHDS